MCVRIPTFDKLVSCLKGAKALSLISVNWLVVTLLCAINVGINNSRSWLLLWILYLMCDLIAYQTKLRTADSLYS